ncbi:MAG: N-6 DNA methylase [Candidatus Heimdallarchaeota archaeon]|nr:MAG: N-6 DNA methylase [Candidatus Heimdallarchaeota archaeon]
MKSSERKKTLGIYHTPPSLAQFVVWSGFQRLFQQQFPELGLKDLKHNFFLKSLNETLNLSTRKYIHEYIKNLKILDLGVGNGAFLIVAGKFLESVYPIEDVNDLIELKLELLQKNLFGVDNNPQAISSCRKNLITWILGTNEPDQYLKKTKEIQQSLECKIRLGNVLLGNITPNAQEYSKFLNEKEVFHWHDEFPSVFDGKGSGFDLILCNPPYVTKDISPEDNRLYRRLYRKQLFINRFNLYHLFFARVFDLLSPNGITVFLTSNSVLTDSYSQKVRDFLQTSFFIEDLVDFVSRTKIFPNVLQGTCILVIRKKNGVPKPETRLIRTFDMKSLIQGAFVDEYIPTSHLFHLRKIIPSPFQETFHILKHLQKTSPLLRNIFRIQSGEIRPADKKIRPYYYKELPENHKVSDFDIVLNGKNVSPYLINLRENRQKPRWYKKPDFADDWIFREDHALIPRIVVQRITAREQLRRIIAGKITNQHLKINKRIWVENNINYFLLKPDFPTNWISSAEALLGILNSLLINWYMHQINLTAAVPPSDLGLIPLPQKKAENHEKMQILHQKVLLIQKFLQTYSSSSEILKHLCPHCTSSEKIKQLQSEIDSLVFQLYEIPQNYQNEIIHQLSQHHEYFGHH